ncbi:MAG: Asp-tRNA(Asn)/Glu-tRNA(Gln) amidotransferase subunit GatC [Methanomicrobiales archaeon]|jgi:aspartyl-tRNA(Asn)/glutamyl-tRNA(Gln) amidotransferase subunit C|nr:Asp-tRNA(Asn)/Glu-tRNA(Gln) amidotransferase subunit GatC [Methanomicrobiales archaeon]
MVNEREVEHIAHLADIGIEKGELEEFTSQFNAILDYFEVLDRIKTADREDPTLYNVFREDEVTPSLPQEAVLENTSQKEEGFFRAPRVM